MKKLENNSCSDEILLRVELVMMDVKKKLRYFFEYFSDKNQVRDLKFELVSLNIDIYKLAYQPLLFLFQPHHSVHEDNLHLSLHTGKPISKCEKLKELEEQTKEIELKIDYLKSLG